MRFAQRLMYATIALLVAEQSISAGRVNWTTSSGGFFTVAAGTPVRLTTTPTRVSRIMIQARHGNSGVVYVMFGVPLSTSCSATNASQLTAELGAGTATSPGGNMSDPPGSNGNTPAEAEDLSQMCIDGTNTGDQVIVTFWKTN